MSSIKIRAKASDGVVTVKSLMTHPMETGQREDKKTGEKIPAHFIQEVTCEHGGATVMKALWSAGVSKNPYLSFKFKGGQEGDKIKLAAPVTLTEGSTCQIVTATHYRRGRQKRRCYRIEETGGLVRLSKASLAGSELLSSAKGAASPVLSEYLAGRD